MSLFEFSLIAILAVVFGALVLRMRSQMDALQQRIERLEWQQNKQGSATIATTASAQTRPTALDQTLGPKITTDPATTSAEPPTKPSKNEFGENDVAATVADPSSTNEPTDDTPKPSTISAQVQPNSPPKAFVFRQENMDKAVQWLTQNWFYAVAAVSLALAGVFLVQYGVENGILTPFWRVMGALGLGLGLIAIGEKIRRKLGDHSDSSTAFLPSTFSGAGIVALFAGVLAARQLYGLIGPEMAFAGLVAVAVVAIVLGWFYGPFLTVVGILGATAAPFLVGGSSDAPHVYYYYFALIAIVGLLIDTIKRWAWTSVMALVASYGAAIFMALSAIDLVHFMVFTLILLAAATIIPQRRLWPDHAGAMVLEVFMRAKNQKLGWAEFPTRLVFGTFAAASVSALVVALVDEGPVEVTTAIIVQSVLFLAATVWFLRAPALRDTAILPPLGLLAVITVQGFTGGSLFQAFVAMADRPPETPLPMMVFVLAGLGMLGSLLAFWRAYGTTSVSVAWSMGAAAIAPFTIGALEFFWQPAQVIGMQLWTAIPMIVAVIMVFLAERCGRVAEARLPTALFAAAAVVMISLSLMLMLSFAALTLALAVLVLVTALLDRKFDLPLLGWIVQIGTVVLGARLVLYPGIDWAVHTSWINFILSFGGSVLLLVATWFILMHRARTGPKVMVESAIWNLAAIGAVVQIWRLWEDDVFSHWGASFTGMVFFIAAATQIYRLSAGPFWANVIRICLAAVLGLIGLIFVLLTFTLLSPLAYYGSEVRGPWIFDTLLAAYGIPALGFAVFAWKLTPLPRWMRLGLGFVAATFAVIYVGFEIRRFWHGDDLSNAAVLDGELYSYTVAMMAGAVALLFYAFGKRSAWLYRLGIIGVGLTIAKVFLIDMSGLAGLIRVASFLGLGMALAGLAWANTQMKRQWERPSDHPEAAGEDEDEDEDEDTPPTSPPPATSPDQT